MEQIVTCKVANKGLNVCERVEVVEWNKRRSPPFPYCPVSRQCSWKKTLIEKKSGSEIIKFKAKDSEIVASPLCLGNISKDWSTDNMKKTGLTGYVYDFSADYSTVTVDDIKDIHNYLMKKNDIV